MTRSVGDDLQTDGWRRLPFRFSKTELATLSSLGPHIGRGARLTDMVAVANALPPEFKSQISELGFHPTPNRAVGFVKSAADNWSLPWHQDRVIAMAEKIDDPQYSNWSLKSGVWHCEAEENILSQMVFAYIAFDDIEAASGGLELAPGTHRQGKILQSRINAHLALSELIAPEMATGDILLVSALTLHRSASWSGRGKRRTLRLDFLGQALSS